VKLRIAIIEGTKQTMGRATVIKAIRLDIDARECRNEERSKQNPENECTATDQPLTAQ